MKRYSFLIFLLFVTVSILITVALIKQKQDIRQRAQEVTSSQQTPRQTRFMPQPHEHFTVSKPGELFSQNAFMQSVMREQRAEQNLTFSTQELSLSTSAVFTPRVLAIGYNPVEGSRNLAQTYFDMEGKTADQFEDYVFNQTVNAFKAFTNNAVQYQIVQKIHVTQFTPNTDGFQFTIDNYAPCFNDNGTLVNGKTCEEEKTNFSHERWIADNHICEIADAANIDEVWVMSAPFVMAWESFMFGPGGGFWVNGPQITTLQCGKHYIVMDAVYNLSGPFLHTYGHRVESTMGYLTSVWTDQDYNNYWEKFSIVSQYQFPYGVPHPYLGIACGNAHWAANSDMHYDYGNTLIKAFNCPDWRNFPNLQGTTEQINCTAWGCNDPGWGSHWLGSLPRNDGDTQMTTYDGRPFMFKKNWWYYLLYPENAIALRNQIAQTPPVSVTPATFGNLSATLAQQTATFTFTYTSGSSNYIIDISSSPNMSSDVYLNFASGSTSPINETNPQKFFSYTCGRILYWRIFNTNRTIQSPIQAATVTCQGTPTPSTSPTPTRTPTPTLTPTPTPTITPTIPITPSISLSPPPTLPGDADSDGDVDIFDYNILVTDFGSHPQGGSPADFDHDGDVDIFDYNTLVSNFGRKL